MNPEKDIELWPEKGSFVIKDDQQSRSWARGGANPTVISKVIKQVNSTCVARGEEQEAMKESKKEKGNQPNEEWGFPGG